MTGSALPLEAKHARRRERWRLLLAIVAITVLYLGIQESWLQLAAQLGHQGWTVNDPAQTYAEEAHTIAAQSQAAEAALPPHFVQQVFLLGLEYGYLSQWLGGYGAQSEARRRQLAQPVAGHWQHLEQLAMQLEVAPVAPLNMRTAADFSELSARLDADEAGVGQRIEAASSPRLRHLFLLACHVGSELAALESARDLLPIPATAMIGKHAVLAGVPEVLWRPLSRYARGTAQEVGAEYLVAVGQLNAWLGATAKP